MKDLLPKVALGIYKTLDFFDSLSPEEDLEEQGVRRTKKGYVSQEMFETLEEMDAEKAYSATFDQYGNLTHLKLNPDKKVFYPLYDRDAPLCSLCKRPGKYISAGHRRYYCEEHFAKKEVINAEIERLQYSKHHPVGYYIMKNGTVQPFLWEPSINYYKVLERKRKTNSLIKIRLPDGTIEGIPAEDVQSIRQPPQWFAEIDERILDEEED